MRKLLTATTAALCLTLGGVIPAQAATTGTIEQIKNCYVGSGKMTTIGYTANSLGRDDLVMRAPRVVYVGGKPWYLRDIRGYNVSSPRFIRYGTYSTAGVPEGWQSAVRFYYRRSGSTRSCTIYNPVRWGDGVTLA